MIGVVEILKHVWEPQAMLDIRELAQYLLDHGAQANVFTAALFGKIDIIKSILEFSPGTLHAKGPHGYTLLASCRTRR